MEKAEKQILDDDEVDFIGGGSTQVCSWIMKLVKADTGEKGDWCVADYSCYTVTLHPDGTGE